MSQLARDSCSILYNLWKLFSGHVITDFCYRHQIIDITREVELWRPFYFKLLNKMSKNGSKCNEYVPFII